MLSAMNYYEKEENIYHCSSIAPFETRDVLAASHMFTLCMYSSFQSQGTNNSPLLGSDIC